MKIAKWVWVTALIMGCFVALQLIRWQFRKEEWQARQSFYKLVKTVFSGAAAKRSASYGIHPFPGNRSPVLPGMAPRKTVILIHGLDDPGLVWRNLAPALVEDGWQVLVMTYPNDQAIHDSACLFHEQLVALSKTRIGGVSIVSHSMGGLVARDMLTNPKFSLAREKDGGLMPRITRLIMVAPPNHGSHFARLQILTEVRDQLFQLVHRDRHWFDFLLDGTGAAGIDLLPGSDFLMALNGYPLPPNVDIRIIAGILSPWPPETVRAVLAGLSSYLPRSLETIASGLADAAVQIILTVGDGLVPVASAQLDDIPVTMVRGFHLPMVRNLMENSSRIPPAVPVILELLDSNSKNIPGNPGRFHRPGPVN